MIKAVRKNLDSIRREKMRLQDNLIETLAIEYIHGLHGGKV